MDRDRLAHQSRHRVGELLELTRQPLVVGVWVKQLMESAYVLGWADGMQDKQKAKEAAGRCLAKKQRQIL